MRPTVGARTRAPTANPVISTTSPSSSSSLSPTSSAAPSLAPLDTTSFLPSTIPSAAVHVTSIPVRFPVDTIAPSITSEFITSPPSTTPIQSTGIPTDTSVVDFLSLSPTQNITASPSGITTMIPTATVSSTPSTSSGTVSKSYPRPSIRPTPFAKKPSLRTTSTPTVTWTASSSPVEAKDPLTVLQFTQQLVMIIADGCAVLDADRASQQAIVLTTARYLQVSPSGVTFTSCDDFLLRSDSARPFQLAATHLVGVNPVSAQMTVQIPSSQYGSDSDDTSKIVENLQARIAREVENGNFTRTLNSLSKSLRADDRTSAATVIGSIAYSISTVTIQYTVSSSAVPTRKPSSSSAHSVAESGFAAFPLWLTVIIIIVGGAIILALSAGIAYFLLLRKYAVKEKTFSSPPVTRTDSADKSGDCI